VKHPPPIARGLRRGPVLRLLVEADYVAGGVAEPGSDLGGVGADGLDDFALVGEDGVEGGGHAVAQDVKQKAGLGGGRASEDEGAADLAGGVVRAYGKPRRLKPVFFGGLRHG
jgi:hypothetical protein